MSTPVS